MTDGNGFTNKEILLRLEAKLDAAVVSHEHRISALETFASRAKGALALATVFLIPLVALILK